MRSEDTKKALTLSLIIPVYNEEHYIASCLDAIQNQSVKPDQVIVVDNNCTDNTVSIAEQYDFVTVIKEEKQGIVYARNTGFNWVNSDIIGRIDADTHINPNWVESVKEIAAKTPDNWAYTGPCKFRDWHGKWLLYWGHRIVFFWSSYIFLGHHSLFGSNMFLKKELWDKHYKTVCKRNDIHEDMDLSIHIKNSGGKILFNRNMKATISPRRIKRMSHYPYMWFKTKLVKHNI